VLGLVARAADVAGPIVVAVVVIVGARIASPPRVT
jgi:hypothetical protein